MRRHGASCSVGESASCSRCRCCCWWPGLPGAACSSCSSFFYSGTISWSVARSGSGSAPVPTFNTNDKYTAKVGKNVKVKNRSFLEILFCFVFCATGPKRCNVLINVCSVVQTFGPCTASVSVHLGNCKMEVSPEVKPKKAIMSWSRFVAKCLLYFVIGIKWDL